MKHKLEQLLKTLIYPVFLWLNIDVEMVQILCLMMVVDTITGSVKAVRIGEDFKPKLLFWGITSKLLLLTVPVVLALAAKGIGYDMRIFVDTLIKLLIVFEFLSFLSNVYMSIKKVKVKKLDAISIIIHYARMGIYNGMIKLKDKIENSGDCKP